MCWAVFWVGSGYKQIEKEFLNRRGAENTEEGKRLDSMQKRVKVKPNSKQQVKEEADDSFTVHLKSPPVDGKANEELIKVLAERFELPKSKNQN